MIIMKNCKNCGTQCNDEFAYCIACGAKLEENQCIQQTDADAENNQTEATSFPLQTEEAAEALEQSLAEPEQTEAASCAVTEAGYEAVVQERPAENPAEKPVLIKCEFCGEMVYSNDKACKNCGAQVDYSKQASIEAAAGEFIASNFRKLKRAGKTGIKKIKAAVISNDKDSDGKILKNNKKYLPVAAVVLVFFILLLVLVPSMTKTPVLSTYGANELSYYSFDDEMIFYNNRRVVAEIEDTHNEPKLSIDNSRAAILSEFDSLEGGSLYLIDAKGEKLIDDGVYYFVMAPSGKAVVYLTDYDYRAGTATLMLYNGRKSVKIKNDISLVINDEPYLVISPDGSAVAYLEKDEDDEFTSYISINGKAPRKFGKYQEIVALSDKAKYVYYIEFEEDRYSGGEFYVKSGNDKVKLAADSEKLGDLLFNEDCTQMLFHYEKKTYLTAKGNEKVKILNNRAYPLLPSNAVQLKFESGNVIYGINSFTDKLLVASEDIYYLDRKHEPNKITGRNYRALVTDDMKKLIYLDYSECLHIVSKLDSKSPKDVELNASDDVVNFAIDGGGSTIYYVNEDDELYSITASNKPHKVADDVARYNLVTLGKKLYFLVDYYDTGALYYTTGKRKSSVKDADEVSYAYRLGNGLIYQEGDYDERAIYGSSNGKNFRRLFITD